MTDPLGFAKVSHAFSGFDECYAFDVSTEEAPIDFLNSKKDALSGLLSSKIDEFKNIKVIACLRIQFVKPLTGVTTQPYMNSSTHVLLNDEIEQTLNDADKNLHLLAPQRKRFLFCIITSERGFLFLIKNLSRL